MRLACLAVLLALTAAPAAARAQSWEQVSDDEGIKVWSREVPNSSFVAFRAQARVQAPLVKLAALIRENSRKPEWMENCSEEHAVRLIDAGHTVVYNRTKSPAFFISDRDVVIDAHASLELEKKTVRVEFHNVTHPKAPPVDGVVRMPNLKGYWQLTMVDPATTDVTYEIEADPGGSLPAWLVNWASSKLPAQTLVKMRIQAQKSGYDKDIEVLESAFDIDALQGAKPSEDPSASRSP